MLFMSKTIPCPPHLLYGCSQATFSNQKLNYFYILKIFFICSLIGFEDELRKEQREIERLVSQKQMVIEAQERQIQTLDSTNSKLMCALNQLKERCHTNPLRNGLTAQPPAKVGTDFGDYKSSAC